MKTKKKPETYWIGKTPTGESVAMKIKFAWRACRQTINTCTFKYPGERERSTNIIGHNRKGLKQVTKEEYEQAFKNEQQEGVRWRVNKPLVKPCENCGGTEFYTKWESKASFRVMCSKCHPQQQKGGEG